MDVCSGSFSSSSMAPMDPNKLHRLWSSITAPQRFARNMSKSLQLSLIRPKDRRPKLLPMFQTVTNLSLALMCRCATILCFSWGTPLKHRLNSLPWLWCKHWTEFSQNFSCLLGTGSVYRTDKSLSFIDLPILGAVLVSPLQRRSICALGMKFGGFFLSF